jgi:hypothetical protein
MNATSATVAVAAPPILHGTYTTPAAQGTLTYAPQRAFRGGSGGRFVVSGGGYPGSMYAAIGMGTGLVCYHGRSVRRSRCGDLCVDDLRSGSASKLSITRSRSTA